MPIVIESVSIEKFLSCLQEQSTLRKMSELKVPVPSLLPGSGSPTLVYIRQSMDNLKSTRLSKESSLSQPSLLLSFYLYLGPTHPPCTQSTVHCCYELEPQSRSPPICSPGFESETRYYHLVRLAVVMERREFEIESVAGFTRKKDNCHYGCRCTRWPLVFPLFSSISISER